MLKTFDQFVNEMYTRSIPNVFYHGSTDKNIFGKNLRSGNAHVGYFYKNIAEDEGSISAVVPNNTFLNLL